MHAVRSALTACGGVHGWQTPAQEQTELHGSHAVLSAFGPKPISHGVHAPSPSVLTVAPGHYRPEKSEHRKNRTLTNNTKSGLGVVVCLPECRAGCT